jgi:hypothetical protein
MRLGLRASRWLEESPTGKPASRQGRCGAVNRWDDFEWKGVSGAKSLPLVFLLRLAGVFHQLLPLK